MLKLSLNPTSNERSQRGTKKNVKHLNAHGSISSSNYSFTHFLRCPKQCFPAVTDSKGAAITGISFKTRHKANHEYYGCVPSTFPAANGAAATTSTPATWSVSTISSIVPAAISPAIPRFSSGRDSF